MQKKGTVTIVIADRDKDHVEFLLKVLENQGLSLKYCEIRVHVAKNAHSALAALAKAHNKGEGMILIVGQEASFRMTGKKLAEKARKNYPGMYLIMYALAGEEHYPPKEGGAILLEKPASEDQLTLWITNIIRNNLLRTA